MNTERIGKATAFILTTVAVLVDGADFLLGFGALGILVDIPAAFFFGVCFSHCGVSMMDPKRVFKFLATIGAEAIPIVNDVPWWTITVVSTIRKEWREPAEI